MKILVTGANGFLGSNLVRSFINQSDEVIALVKSRNNIWRLKSVMDNIEIQQCDITDTKELRKIIKNASPDGVVHTAIYGGYPNQENETQIYNTNLFGTTNIINESFANGVDWFINTGSSSEYGNKSQPMNENDLCEPVNSYGISKLASTLYAKSYARLNEAQIFTFRIFSAYGPYEDHNRLIPYLFTKLLSNEEPSLSSPNPVRDFIFIDDIISAYHMAIEKYRKISPGEIFNLGTSTSHTVNDVANLLCKLSYSS